MPIDGYGVCRLLVPVSAGKRVCGPCWVRVFHVLDVGPVTRVPTDAPSAGEGAVERFRAIAEHSSDMLMIVDAERVVGWANGAFERVVGLSAGVACRDGRSAADAPG